MKRDRILRLIIAAAMMLGLLGCSSYPHSAWLADDPKNDMRFQSIVSALKEKDHDGIKSLFSNFALENAPNIDAEIEYLLKSFKGDIVTSQYIEGSTSESVNYGVKVTTTEPRGEIETTENNYALRYIDCLRDDTNENNIGISKFIMITEAEDDTIAWDFLYNESITAGIYKPGDYPIGINNHTDETFEKVQLYLQRKDHDALKQLFSVAVIESTSNLDEQIVAAMDCFKGTIDHATTGGAQIGGEWGSGNHVVTTCYGQDVFTDSARYHLAFFEIILNEQQPEQVGLCWVYIAEYEDEEQLPLYAPDDLKPGVHIADNVVGSD